MKGIQDIFNWLKKSERHHIDIYDPRSDVEIDKRLNAKTIEDDKGGFDNYLSDLRKEYPSVSVVRTKKQGSAYISYKSPQLFRLQTTVAEESASGLSPAAPSSSSLQPALAHPGQQGMGMPGLGAYIDATNKAALLGEITRQKEKAESQLDHLRKENDRLKDELNKAKRDYDTQPDALTSLINNALESGQAAQIIEVFMSRKSNPAQGMAGLNAPKLSATKRELISYIEKPEVTDTIAGYAFAVIHFALQGNVNFINGYRKLIDQQNNNQENQQQNGRSID